LEKTRAEVQSMTRPNISVRKAQGSDREAVFKFCEKTWSWGDYVQKVWDKWLKQKDGRLFVATIKGVPVGISHVSIDKPHEVWLRGARTDPDYRRKGVATAITRKCLEYAKTKGAKVARLITESDNKAAQAVLQKLEFKKVSEFVNMKNERVTTEKAQASEWATKNDMETLWNHLQSSETYSKAAGLYTTLYHWFSLEKEDLARFLEQQKAILHKNKKGKTDGLTLIEDATAREWHENTIQTCYIDGNHNAALDMTKFLKTHCKNINVEKIYGFTCNHKPVTSALEKLGFKPPNSIELVYERKIQLTHSLKS
jgi:ribosomal protein S18 acetylase RimI-like enzyme